MKIFFVPEKDNVKLNIDLSAKIPLPSFIYRFYKWPLLIYRRLKYGYTFMRIPLTKGQFAIVDVEDYEKLASYNWCVGISTNGYHAVRALKANSHRHCGKKIKMHRQIMNVSDDKVVDHINHNSLDNRRANLRIVTALQNSWNKRKQRGTYSSKYKGVTWHKRDCKWEAGLRCNGKLIYIGQFDDEKEAAKAYNAKAAELFGQFASLNDI